MKRLLLITTFILIAVWGVMALAQQTTPKLSPEASQRFIEHENRKAVLRQQYADAQSAQNDLMIGAGIPAEQRKAVAEWQPGQPNQPWQVKGDVIEFPVKPKEAKPIPK